MASIRERLILSEIKQKYGLVYSYVGGRRGVNKLGSYPEALKLAMRDDGKEILTYIFDICSRHMSAFCEKANGLSTQVMGMLRDAFINYPEQREETKQFISNLLRPIDPINVKSMAVAKYPVLDYRMACSLWLEDQIVESLGFPRRRRFDDGSSKIIKLPA